MAKRPTQSLDQVAGSLLSQQAERRKQYEKDKKAFENKWSSNWIKKDILNTNKETK